MSEDPKERKVDLAALVDYLGALRVARLIAECKHERLNEEGICRRCGEDCRGAH